MGFKGGRVKLLSVKKRLTLWIVSLMLLLVSVVLSIMVGVSNSVVASNTQERLENAVRANLTGITQENGKLQFGENFMFTRNGIYTVVYSDAGALLAGQLPLSFPEGVAFENGRNHVVAGNNADDYFVLDFRLPFGWENGVWVRGIVQVPEVAYVLDDLLGIALFVLPIVVVVSGLGAYAIACSTFRPIDRMIRTVSAISEGRDLTRRIGLPPGQDEICRLGQAFDNMVARLQASFESEEQFASDASHELRTPTAVILAQCADVRENEQTVTAYVEAIDVIERQAQRMNTLISQLLHMTRLEQGTQQTAFEWADLSGLVKVICEEQPVLLCNIKLETEIEPGVDAWFDVTLMSRLLQNLIDNAARYGRKNGHIWVSLQKKMDKIRLSVRDDGIGIPADKLDKIWNRFYQVESAREAKSGTGLGLTMVRQIAQLHKGKVSVDSREGIGSCFTLEFPVGQPISELEHNI